MYDILYKNTKFSANRIRDPPSRHLLLRFRYHQKGFRCSCEKRICTAVMPKAHFFAPNGSWQFTLHGHQEQTSPPQPNN
jgi:hypothetical protein